MEMIEQIFGDYICIFHENSHRDAPELPEATVCVCVSDGYCPFPLMMVLTHDLLPRMDLSNIIRAASILPCCVVLPLESLSL